MNRIDAVKLQNLLGAGKSPAQCARYFQVSKAAVSRAMKKMSLGMRVPIPKVVPLLEKGQVIVSEDIHAVQQLTRINQKANDLLDQLTGEDKLIDRMVDAVKGALAFEGDPRMLAGYVQKIVKQVCEDRALALKTMAEIRGQLGLQLQIFETLYNLEAVEKFQAEVLFAIGEADEETRKRIVERLKARRVLRTSIHLSR